MKLIKEITESVNYLTEESADGKQTLFIEGPFLVTERTNRNGRMYKEETMRKEVHRYTENYINKHRAFGELGHPDTPSINLDRVSHLIVSLRQEGNDWIGKAKILDTPMGNIARNLIEGGAQLGVSSRGMGSLKSINGVNIVQDDFYLATAADIVADPSAPGAFVQGIMEGKEWVWNNGILKEVEISQIKEELDNAPSRKVLDETSINAFKKLRNLETLKLDLETAGINKDNFNDMISLLSDNEKEKIIEMLKEILSINIEFDIRDKNESKFETEEKINAADIHKLIELYSLNYVKFKYDNRKESTMSSLFLIQSKHSPSSLM